MSPTTSPRVAAPPRPELAPPPSPRRVALMTDLAMIRADLTADLTADLAGPRRPRPKPPAPPWPAAPIPLPAPAASPARSGPGVNLTVEQMAILDDVIARHPADSARRIARRFGELAGRPISGQAVNHRRRNPSHRRRVAALSSREVAILLQEIRLAGPNAPRQRVADWFAKRTGRTVHLCTVSRYALQAEGRYSRTPGPAAAWHDWTDAVAVDIAWEDADIINLGPAAEAIGGGRP